MNPKLPHLENETYYNMGSKTFWYLFSKKSVTGFVFLIAAFVLSFARANFASDVDTAILIRTASWLSFIIAAAGFLIAVLSSKIIYKNTGFTLTDSALILRRGVIKREEFAMPYRQIQNIEIERSLGARALGISKFIILTAGEETEEESQDAPENIVPAMDWNVAESLQRELLKRANIQKVISA